MSDSNYSEYVAWAAEGRRVAIVTCMQCGASILLDARGPDAVAIHDAWHAQHHTTETGGES